jgi:hypothetical protein
VAEAVSIGTLVALPLSDGWFGACQVVANLGASWDVVALDWTGPKAPRAGALRRAKPLQLTDHGQGSSVARIVIHSAPPAGFDTIGSMEPTVKGPPPANHGPWIWLVQKVEAEAAWSKLPAAEVARYEKCRREGQTTSRYSVGHAPYCDAKVEPGAPFDWSRLDELGCLLELEVVGPLEGLFDYLATRRIIRSVLWREHGCSSLDASALLLDTLNVDVPSGGLRLTAGVLRCLSIVDWTAGGAIEIEHPSHGEGLLLELLSTSRTSLSVALGHLPQLTELSASNLSHVDGRALAGYPKLRALRLLGERMMFAHVSSLAELAELERFELTDCYDFDPADLPLPSALPRLRSAEFVGLRKTAAQVIKKRWAKLPELAVRGAKGDAWLAANADNPFNNWLDHHDAAVAKAACGAYEESLGTMQKLKASQPARITVEVKRFIAAFNNLPCDPSIDTIEREEIWDALVLLVTTANLAVEPKDLETWFDQEREF